MDISSKILSDITVYMKYARYLPELKRRETWEEIVVRTINMHVKKYPQLKDEIERVFRDFVLTKKVLPSMRCLQFAGKPIEINPARLFNCSFLTLNYRDAFSEAMFLLLGGSGVGYSCQKAHIEELPPIRKSLKSRRYVIEDSIVGWADAVRTLINAYMFDKSMPIFDYSDIREKGAPLLTSGGKAPGPQPLKDCLHNIQKVLDSVPYGNQLSTLQAHDIMCYISDAVLAGGIRRASCIALFDLDDKDMLYSKSGDWYELNPQRGRANNSVVLLRHKIDEKEFFKLWDKIKANKTGEPGIFFTNNKDIGANPCCEISLKSQSFCNLSEINMGTVEDQFDLNERAKAASFIGTLQSGYTDFYYLNDKWKKNSEKEALLGISGTGIASGAINGLDLESAVKVALEENTRISNIIGVKKAARITCVKPSGTASLVLGTSSGIHSWFAPYYIRRIRVGKNEAIYKYLAANHPNLVEDEFFKPHLQSVISIPVKAPDDAIFSTEPAINILERIKKFNKEWIRPGHSKGDNYNNVSATIYVKENEWDIVGNWLWENKEYYNGITVLPADVCSYPQMPFERITEDEYNKMAKSLKEIDLTKVREEDDDTNLAGEVACGGGSCELK